jgi:uncharacterized membrane protein
MGPDSNLYKLVLLLHILAAIVGFGAVFLNGFYGIRAKNEQGTRGNAITEANWHVTHIAEFVIYSVPVFGILLVVLSDELWKFSQAWVSLALLLYIIAIAISHAVMIPSTKKMISLQRELVDGGPPPAGASGPPPQVMQMEALGKRLSTFGPVLNLLLVAILFLMVFKPFL